MHSATTDPTPSHAWVWVGVVLLGAWAWWTFGWATTLSAVSPVHWPLLLPQMAIEAVPGFAGGLAGTALLLKKRVARPLLLVFAVTIFHATILTMLAPEIHDRYQETIRQSQSILRLGG